LPPTIAKPLWNCMKHICQIVFELLYKLKFVFPHILSIILNRSTNFTIFKIYTL
jgi:hypothetical protein